MIKNIYPETTIKSSQNIYLINIINKNENIGKIYTEPYYKCFSLYSQNPVRVKRFYNINDIYNFIIKSK